MGLRITWAGQGPRVLLVPGWNTTAAMVSSWLPDAFRGAFCLGILEWPGLGTAAGEPLPMRLDRLLETWAAELPEPVDVVGFCLGGVAAWALGQRHPEQVRRVVVAETPRHFPAILAPLLVPGLGEAILALARGTAWGQGLVRRAILQPRAYSEPFLDCLFDFEVGPSLHYLRHFRAFGKTLGPPYRLEPPCWRLEGEVALRVMGPALGRRLAVPVEVIRIPGAGHFPAVEAPEAFFETLAALLSGAPAPAPTGPAPGR